MTSRSLGRWTQWRVPHAWTLPLTIEATTLRGQGQQTGDGTLWLIGILPPGVTGFNRSIVVLSRAYEQSGWVMTRRLRRLSGTVLLITVAVVAPAVVVTSSPASADMVVDGCTIVSNPTPTDFTNCPGATLAGADLSGVNLSYANLAAPRHS